MQEIEEIYIDLIMKVYEKFTFFIPMAVAEDENMRGVLQHNNIKLDDEFFDKYVDILLYLDQNMGVHQLLSIEDFNSFIATKNLNLSNNCAKLAGLKDTMGETSFRYVFENYKEVLVCMSYSCDRLVEYFYEHYPENPTDLTYLFRRQKLILQTHIHDLEKVILSSGEKIDESAVMRRIAEILLKLPPVQEHNLNIKAQDILELKEDSTSPPHHIRDDITPLANYINHEHSTEIALIIVKKYRNRSPKTIRLLKECLEELNLITLLRGEPKKFIEALNLSFQNEKELVDKSIIGKKPQKMTHDYKSLKIELLKAISTYYK